MVDEEKKKLMMEEEEEGKVEGDKMWQMRGKRKKGDNQAGRVRKRRME